MRGYPLRKSARTSKLCASSGASFLRQRLDLRGIGVELALVDLPARRGRERAVRLQVAIQELIVDLLEVEERIVRAARGADQLVELDLDRRGVPVLRVLDQEHHQEGDDRGRGIDDELPRVAETEKRPAGLP